MASSHDNRDIFATLTEAFTPIFSSYQARMDRVDASLETLTQNLSEEKQLLEKVSVRLDEQDKTVWNVCGDHGPLGQRLAAVETALYDLLRRLPPSTESRFPDDAARAMAENPPEPPPGPPRGSVKAHLHNRDLILKDVTTAEYADAVVDMNKPAISPFPQAMQTCSVSNSPAHDIEPRDMQPVDENLNAQFPVPSEQPVLSSVDPEISSHHADHAPATLKSRDISPPRSRPSTATPQISTEMNHVPYQTPPASATDITMPLEQIDQARKVTFDDKNSPQSELSHPADKIDIAVPIPSQLPFVPSPMLVDKINEVSTSAPPALDDRLAGQPSQPYCIPDEPATVLNPNSSDKLSTSRYSSTFMDLELRYPTPTPSTRGNVVNNPPVSPSAAPILYYISPESEPDPRPANPTWSLQHLRASPEEQKPSVSSTIPDSAEASGDIHKQGHLPRKRRKLAPPDTEDRRPKISRKQKKSGSRATASNVGSSSIKRESSVGILAVGWPKRNGRDEKFQHTFISCDNCKCWIHYGCAGIETHKQAEQTFICPPCQVASTQEYIRRMTMVHDLTRCTRPDCFASGSNADNEPAEYAVERIIGRKQRSSSKFAPKSKRYYWLVKWEGYSVKFAEWLGEENMGLSIGLVRAFENAAAREGYGEQLRDRTATIQLNEVPAKRRSGQAA